MEANQTRREFIKLAGAVTLAVTALPVYAQEKKITVAFVGVAHIHTPGYLKLVKQRPDVQIKYVWDHDSERAARRAKEVDAQVPPDAKTIWSDPEITAVVILSETNLHHELVLAAVKSGKHMFVEKPLGITAHESHEMAEAIEKAGVLFTTGYFMRTDAKNPFLKSQIDAGNFGTITRVFASNCHNGSLGGWFDTEWSWMADPKIAGVGAFGDLGTHQLDILMWLFGNIESVTAEIRPVTHRYGDCDETGQALIRFKSGVFGTLAAGWVDIGDPVKLLISGTEGTAVLVNDQLFYRSQKVSGSDSRKPWTEFPSGGKAPMQQFFDAVNGSKDQPLVTPHEAAARVTAMEAMYSAAREQKWINVS
jgi:predicted dehydrogenase